MNLFKVLLAITLMTPQFGLAQTVDKQMEFNSAWGVDYKSNLIKNPSAAKNANSKTGTGTATRDVDVADKIDNKASWNISLAAGQYVEFDLLTPSSEQASGNGEFKGIFKGTATGAEARITDGSGNVLVKSTLTAETGWRGFTMNYPLAAAGTRKVRFHNPTGGALIFNVGQLHYGQATNIGTGVQNNVFSAKVSATGVVTDEYGGDWIAGNCAIGVNGDGNCQILGFDSPPNCEANRQITSAVNFTPNGTVATMGLISNTNVYYMPTGNTGSPADVILICNRKAAPAQSTITQSSVPQSWSGYMFANGWSRASSAFGDFNAGTGINLTTRTSKNMSVTMTAGGLPSISFNANSTASFHVCATIPTTASSVTSGYLSLVGVNGTNIMVQTAFPVNSTGVNNVSICGIFVPSSIGVVNIKVNGAIGAGTIALGTTVDSAVQWTIAQTDDVGNAPQLLGSVTSNASAALRDEYAAVEIVCTTTPCTVAFKSSDWISSVVRNSVGNYSINFVAGTFSVKPFCQLYPTGIVNVNSTLFNTTTSATTWNTNLASTSELTDTGLMLRCIGLR